MSYFRVILIVKAGVSTPRDGRLNDGEGSDWVRGGWGNALKLEGD